MRDDKEGFSSGDNSPLEWHNKEAAAYVQTLIAKFGMPSSVDPTPGGIVVWKKDRLATNSCIDRIEVRDEAIPDVTPEPHNDFVYLFVTYDVAPSKFLEVTSVSGTVSYDPLKKQLRVRCGSYETCTATLALCVQVGEGHLSLNYVQSNDLYNQYYAAAHDPEQFARLRDLLCYNLKHQQGTTQLDGYWPLAVQANLPLPANIYP